MDRRYEALLAVAEAGSFSEAARRLYLTQPTVSRQVGSLEAELGVRLFERCASSACLTDAGRIVEECARRVGELEARMRAELEGLATRGREFVLLCPDNMVTYDYEVFWQVVQAASRIMGAKVRVEPTPALCETREALRQGRADAAIGMMGAREGSGGLAARRLLVTSHTPAYMLFAEGHRLVGLAAVSDWSELDGLTVCLPSDDLQNTQLFLERAHESQVLTLRTERVSSTPAMLPLVAAGDVVGFSAFPLRDVAHVRCVPIRLYEPQPFGLVWAAGRHDLPFERFADEVARIYEAAHPDDVL